MKITTKYDVGTVVWVVGRTCKECGGTKKIKLGPNEYRCPACHYGSPISVYDGAEHHGPLRVIGSERISGITVDVRAQPGRREATQEVRYNLAGKLELYAIPDDRLAATHEEATKLVARLERSAATARARRDDDDDCEGRC